MTEATISGTRGEEVLEDPEVRERIDAHQAKIAAVWQPDAWVGALMSLLR